MSAAVKPRRSEADRAERRERDRRRIAEAVAALQSEEGWQRWLRVRRRFHPYSFHNQLLIAWQRPEATRVAGFRKWLELGYCVRKGERGVRILAPCPPSKKAVERWRARGADPHSEPRTHFRSVAVFDRSQVDPIPDHPGGAVALEPPHEPVTGDGLAHLIEPLAALAASLGSEVSFEPITGPTAGYHQPSSGRIVIDNGAEHSPNAQLATLVHEVAHALCGVERRPEESKLPHRVEEVVVESVAYSVCASIGLDTGGESVPYLADWGGAEAGEQIEACAALIDRLAKRIEDALPTDTGEET